MLKYVYHFQAQQKLIVHDLSQMIIFCWTAGSLFYFSLDYSSTKYWSADCSTVAVPKYEHRIQINLLFLGRRKRNEEGKRIDTGNQSRLD